MSAAKHIVFIAGTRPNFMKVAPLLRECQKYPKIKTSLIHTGQHYDATLSEVFFKQLGIRNPDYLLKAGDYSGKEQIDYIAQTIAELFTNNKPDLVVVVGDVNSTLGGAKAGELMKVPVAHVEAGLRSFDDRMPEEHNRIAIDKISTYLFVSEPSGLRHIKSAKILNKKVYFVGNVMIDTLHYEQNTIQKIQFSKKLGLQKKDYVVLTLHRKENLEDPVIFKNLLGIIEWVAERKPVIWPLHCHTQKRLQELDLYERIASNPHIKIIEPLGYHEFSSLLQDSLCIVTDSGGVQDETTIYDIPCLTIRRTTERPITASIGSSTLIGENGEKLKRYLNKVLTGTYKHAKIPKFWDGKAAARIMKIISRV